MKKKYIAYVKEVEENGMLSLASRKEIWKSFEADCVSGKEKRFLLALECVRKVNNALLENNPLYQIRGVIKEFLDIMEDIKRDRDYDEVFDNILIFCEETVEATDSFVVGYFQQALEHMVEIKERDEPLILQRYDQAIADSSLELEETDTSYGTSIVWKYQDECASKYERKRKERQFWLWYIRKAAEIQGIDVNDIAEEFCVTEDWDKELRETGINTLEDFVEQVSCDYKFISAEKKNNIITLKVLNLNNDNNCPTCGHVATNSEEFWGRMDLGRIKDWEVTLQVKEHVYYCDNPLCGRGQFFPRDKDNFIERMANFTYIRSIVGINEKLNKIFENI